MPVVCAVAVIAHIHVSALFTSSLKIVSVCTGNLEVCAHAI